GWLSSAFALLAVWCATRASSTRWFIASGVAAAAAYAFKQNAGVFVLAAILLWCGRKRLLVMSGAFVAATLAWLIPLALAMQGRLAALGVLVGEVNQAGLWTAPDPTNLIPVAC